MAAVAEASIGHELRAAALTIEFRTAVVANPEALTKHDAADPQRNHCLEPDVTRWPLRVGGTIQDSQLVTPSDIKLHRVMLSDCCAWRSPHILLICKALTTVSHGSVGPPKYAP
jgi:hypothetical protein